MGSNAAAWLPEAKAYPMQIGDAPFPTPNAGEVVVKIEAIAINPMDWMIQTMGNDLFGFLKYPYIGGTDVAGTITHIGEGVANVKVGDRVLGMCVSVATNDARDGAFQKYAILQSHMVSPIPSTLPAADAAVLPMGVCTASAALYQKGYLELAYPSTESKPNGKTLLVWAGSSSVGSNAIQLAKASGYEVITTASPKNFDFVKKLGASQVFDYSSPTVKEDLIKAFEGKECAGAFALLPGSVEVCIEVVHKSRGAKMVAMAIQHAGELPEGVKTNFVFATTVKDNGVGKAIFGEYLPKALAQGKYTCAPQAFVVGHGLEALQDAVDTVKKGVSAKKVVVTI